MTHLPIVPMLLALALLGGCVAGQDTEPGRTALALPAGKFRLLLHFGAEQRSCAGANVDVLDIYVDGDVLGSKVACTEEPLELAMPATARLVEVLAFRQQAGGSSWYGEVPVTDGQPAAKIELTVD